MSRLPTAWSRSSPVALEPVLQHPRPGHAPLVVAAERGQRHPQVAGREDAELAAQPARRAAVVGDGHHGGQLVDDGACSSRSADSDACSPWPPPKATTATARSGVRSLELRHSRPRSRW